MKKQYKAIDFDNAMKLAMQDSSDIKLSRKSKKRIKSEIFQNNYNYYNFRIFAASFAGFLLVFSALVITSKPGSVFYSIKRGVEDVRSAIQPSFDDKLLEQREKEKSEVQNTSNSNTNPDTQQKVEIIEKEIDKIENRINSRESEDGSSNEDNAVTDSITETETENESENSSTQSNTSDDNKTMSAKDSCKAELDARKKAGENINSDLYKTCDNL